VTEPDALQVLLVEDSPTDAKLVGHELRRLARPVAVERVETAAAMRAALQRQDWDVILSDWSLPDFNAPAALAIARELRPDVPLIIVSGTIGEEAAVDAMHAGARDYVLKDKLGRLLPVLERELLERSGRLARRQAEAALKESEARFRRLAESGVVGIIVVEPSGRLQEANDAFLQMVGYSRDDVAAGDLTWERLTPPEQRTRDREAAGLLDSHLVAHPWEKEYLRKDGTAVAVLVTAARLDDGRYISLSIDLREQKRAEVARARAEVALRHSEDQLRQAQKMEAVGRLAGGVAHDFNNLLSVILSYSELVQDGLAHNDPLRADLGEIHEAATRASALTRQLLLFSRQQIVEPRVIDLGDVVSGLNKMLHRMVGEDVDVTVVAPEHHARVNADPNLMEQVLLNLVVNARDAMPKGGKLTIQIENVKLDDGYAARHLGVIPGRYVRLAVKDTGVGIPAEIQSRIFEPFFTTKDKGKGTGLGLSTVFGIVQQSGGHIAVDSEVGRGTTFNVYLPRVDGDLSGAIVLAPSGALRGTETVLLVEDERQVRTIADNILRRHGYNVLVAQNAGDALLICEREASPIHLLLTDVVMPHLSGPELAARLGRLRPDMKVLFMSGYTDDSAFRHGAVEGSVGFLQKPITPALLARKVREVLDHRGAGAT